MKFSINTDFTKLPRALSVLRAGTGAAEPFDAVMLAHDERHLRRRVVELVRGERILVDLLEQITLADHDRLVLEDGRQVEILAVDEEVYEIRARDAVHLAELAWHLGGRHLAIAIEASRILILRDHVDKAMLEELGVQVTEISAPFEPLRAASSGGHAHDHHHEHQGHGQPDRFGRLPGDPHYGHNHA
ncbi:urease accessory protein UreE [Mesorhizobium sp. BE184]|uniref:urease accessory protein UreE n=1 Tax=Mesorhizobium sp. BE184 TaxID=2817714 RepID=UPI0028556296|nr:urease accessory protein UreE [Mesorhizobium sp. BE184]MDR7033456.1 urease accessory protein [Mesorhizobium sp. BE184]